MCPVLIKKIKSLFSFNLLCSDKNDIRIYQQVHHLHAGKLLSAFSLSFCSELVFSTLSLLQWAFVHPTIYAITPPKMDQPFWAKRLKKKKKSYTMSFFPATCSEHSTHFQRHTVAYADAKKNMSALMKPTYTFVASCK